MRQEPIEKLPLCIVIQTQLCANGNEYQKASL